MNLLICAIKITLLRYKGYKAYLPRGGISDTIQSFDVEYSAEQLLERQYEKSFKLFISDERKSYKAFQIIIPSLSINQNWCGCRLFKQR